MLHIENLKESTKKFLLEVKKEKFSKVAAHKINMQKSVGFLYTENKESKNEN